MTSEDAANEQEQNPSIRSTSPDQGQAPASMPSSPSTEPENAPIPGQLQTSLRRTKDWQEHVKFWAELLGLVFLIVYTVFTGLMYRANRQAAKAAESAANTAARQLELTERPWVSIEDARVTSPLTFGPDGAHVGIEIVLRNSGASPAVEVSITPKLYLLPRQEGTPRPVDRLCNNNIPPGISLPGLTLFPNTDSPAERYDVTLSKEEMITSAHGGPIVVITPVICVAYRPTFNPEARYYSGIQYLLWPTIFLDKMTRGSSIPIDKLPLSRNGFFGESAH